ncbi:hypothetical protein Hanom_Chr16g01501471 [Helianthus anomalus]
MYLYLHFIYFIPPFHLFIHSSHVFIHLFHVFIPPLHVFHGKNFSPYLIWLLTKNNRTKPKNRQIN